MGNIFPKVPVMVHHILQKYLIFDMTIAKDFLASKNHNRLLDLSNRLYHVCICISRCGIFTDDSYSLIHIFQSMKLIWNFKFICHQFLLLICWMMRERERERL